jgi:hypothetical protein
VRVPRTDHPAVPPWPSTLAALLAFAAFWVGDGPSSPALPTLALALLAVYAVPFRVVRATRSAWLNRLALYAVAFALNAGHEPQLQDTWISAAGMNFLGPLLAAELVLRAWHTPTSTRQMLTLSAFLVLFGCATGDDRVGLFLVPPYFFCVIFALRADRDRSAERGSALMGLWRMGAVVLAFLIGGAAQWSFRVYKAEILEWGSAALGEHLRSASSAQVSGIVKDPTLGPTFGSPGSSARILRVVGALPDPHLHGMAFDTYAHGAWLPTLNGRHFSLATPAELGASASGVRIHITRFVGDDGMVSAPLSGIGLLLEADAAPTWSQELGGPLRHETGEVLSYDVVLGPTDEAQGPLCAPPTPAERAHCLAVPSEIAPGVRTLARKIVGQAAGPCEKIEAVEDYLLQNNKYSLRTNPGQGDPVSNFLLGHKAAHCEFFASSAAILLRCMGVPTRYAIGYYAHEREGPGVTVVRGQDAHAWAESWIDGVGWVVVEATPGNGRPSETAHTPWWWKWRDRWQDLTLALQAAAGHLTPMRLASVLAVLVVVLLVPSVIRAMRARRSGPVPVFVYAAPPPDLAELAAHFEAWLTRQGIPSPSDIPWEDHLTQVAKNPSPAQAPTLPEAERVGRHMSQAQTFIAAYNRARFGGPENMPARAEAAEALRRLEAYL